MVNKLPSYASRKCIIYKYLLGGFLKIELDNKFQEFYVFSICTWIINIRNAIENVKAEIGENCV